MLLPSEGMGGAEAQTLRLLPPLREAGVAVVLAAPPALSARLREAGESPEAAALAPGDRAAQAVATAALLARHAPDAVLLALPWPDHGAGAFEALAASGAPVLVVAHLVPRGPVPGLDERALRAASALRGTWAAVSAPAAARLESLLGFPSGRVTAVPNGADPPPPGEVAAERRALRRRLDAPEEVPVALVLGRLAEAKGADLLPALAVALHREAGALLAAAGEGPLDPHLRAAAPPGHPLRLLGRETRPAGALRGADLLLLPSRLEGCPLVFLEAAGQGVPVVASEEALEWLGPSAARVAALAPAGDPGALAGAAARLLARPEEARRFSAAAARMAGSWDAAAMARCHAALLRSAVS